MRKLTFILSVFVATMIFSSCQSYEAAKETGKKFHEFFKAENYEGMANLIHSEELKLTPKEKWTTAFSAIIPRLGNLKSFENTGMQVKTQNGITRVAIKYTLVFEKATMYERLHFAKDGDKFKITKFQFNKDRDEVAK